MGENLRTLGGMYVVLAALKAGSRYIDTVAVYFKDRLILVGKRSCRTMLVRQLLSVCLM